LVLSIFINFFFSKITKKCFFSKKAMAKKHFLEKSVVKKKLFRKKYFILFYFIFQKVKIKIKISKEI
jgi:hypothetical protein